MSFISWIFPWSVIVYIRFFDINRNTRTFIFKNCSTSSSNQHTFRTRFNRQQIKQVNFSFQLIICCFAHFCSKYFAGMGIFGIIVALSSFHIAIKIIEYKNNLIENAQSTYLPANWIEESALSHDLCAFR